jgi:predicted ATP-dependent endonuclease of OLD family
MIRLLKINNFKSIKGLEINPHRINLFIGEPNTGKSNLLEALGLLSWCGLANVPLGSFVRFQLTQHLFYDGLTDEPISLSIIFEKNEFHFRTDPGGSDLAKTDYHGRVSLQRPLIPQASGIRFYRYRDLEKFESNEISSLIPPDGLNLFSVVYGSKVLREHMTEFFRPYGLTLVMRPHEKAFELQKQQDGVVTSIPYSLASATLRRIVFYTVAMASNKDCVLVFEEPEAHAFPYYTKYLGERIALDPSNQYFIATHNPYLLGAIVDKAKKDDVAVFAVYFEDYQTKVKQLSDAELSTLMDADPFLSLQSLIKGESQS